MNTQFTQELRTCFEKQANPLEEIALRQIKGRSTRSMEAFAEDLARTSARTGPIRKNVLFGLLDGAVGGGLMGYITAPNTRKGPITGAILGALLGAGIGLDQGSKDLKRILNKLERNPESLRNAYISVGATEDQLAELTHALTPQHWLESSEKAMERGERLLGQ